MFNNYYTDHLKAGDALRFLRWLDDKNKSGWRIYRVSNEEPFILETGNGSRIKNLVDFAQDLFKGLSDREQDVVFRRGVRKQTLEEIGSQYQITRERVRQEEAKALSKLSLRSSQLLKRNTTGYNEMGFAEKRVLTTNMKEFTVDCLGLTERSYNALMRNNLKTVDDILSHSVSELRKMKGVGAVSLNDIATCIYNETGLFILTDTGRLYKAFLKKRT